MTQSAAAVFPDKPVNLVVAFAAGGPTDVVTRALADKLSERLGQPAVVLNKPGSGGLVGAEFVAKSKAEQHAEDVALGKAPVEDCVFVRIERLEKERTDAQERNP